MNALCTSIIDRFNVKVVGNGTRPLMFAHGLGCSQVMWRYIYPAFENDYKIILFDYISRRSAVDHYDEERYLTLDGYAQDIIDIAHELNLKEIRFVGHSISSMIGMLASFKEPQLFSGLNMLAPSPRYINDNDYIGGLDCKEAEEILYQIKHNLSNWASAFTPQVIGNVRCSQMEIELRKSICDSDPDIFSQFAELTFRSDFRNDLQNIWVPTLILQGAKDIVAPIHIGQYMKDRIPGAILHMMQAEGHYSHLSNPGETTEALKQYL